MEAQERTSKAQQEALDNIQQILAQLLINRTPMTLVAIAMKMSITMMGILRLISQGKLLD